MEPGRFFLIKHCGGSTIIVVCTFLVIEAVCGERLV